MSFCSITNVKATRKLCTCDWCGEQIEKGQPKVVNSGHCEGDFYSVNAHPECHAAAQKWWKEWGMLEDGIPYERNMQRGSTEPR